ncbi:MAG: hypothetical protein ACI4J0_02450 [Huintestinicola sp.]|uniref:hypothetical protein n=1 Tax=Huintestinicola sp. TaxID=2981661 RepID=UPI003F0999E9
MDNKNAKYAKYIRSLGDELLVYMLELIQQGHSNDEIATSLGVRWLYLFPELTWEDWRQIVEIKRQGITEFSCFGFPQLCGYPSDELFHCEKCREEYENGI